MFERMPRQTSLFAAGGGPMTLLSGAGDVTFYEAFLEGVAADALVAEIRSTTDWQTERRMMYDRLVWVPRETAARGAGTALGWTPVLQRARELIESRLGTHFDYVFLNRYRDGNDSVAWHGDHESERCTIASLSLGATRLFELRPRASAGVRAGKIAVELAHGDLIVMRAETQRFWEHRVPKEPRIRGERINITFRQL